MVETKMFEDSIDYLTVDLDRRQVYRAICWENSRNANKNKINVTIFDKVECITSFKKHGQKCKLFNWRMNRFDAQNFLYLVEYGEIL